MAAHALGFALRGAGYEAFVDTGSIGVGDLYRQVIEDAVARSQVMFVLLGPAFDVRRLHEPSSVLAFEWQRARFHGIGVVPVLVEGAPMPADEALPAPLRWLTRHNALSLRTGTLDADLRACVAAAPAFAVEPRRAARVLWIDDKPSNNEFERKWLRPHGLVFDCVVSTEEALEQLENESYDLVITDLGRQHSSDRSATAGADFLDQPVVKQGGPPVLVYAGQWAMLQRDALLARGALEVTNDRSVLLGTVLKVLGRGGEGLPSDLAGR